jgi:hypothetical protein
MQNTTSKPKLMTYSAAAERLGLSRDYISHIAASGMLHPMKLLGDKRKYLRQDEVDWFGKRRKGTIEPNPVVLDHQDIPQPSADEFAGLFAALPSEGGAVGEAEGNGALVTASPRLALPDLSALLLLFIVASILLAIMKHEKPDPETLDQLRSAPQFKTVRTAIHQLDRAVNRDTAA